MKRSPYIWFLPFAAATCLTLWAVRNHRMAERQSAALGFERRQNLELLGLEAENRRLEASQLSDAERQRLEASHAEAAALRERLGVLQQKPAEGEGGEPPRLLAKDWVFAGRATPRATIESVLWAASRGDIDRLAMLVGFGPELRTQADAMFSQLPPASQQEYGSPEKVVAMLLAGSFPKDAQSSQILVDHQYGEQDAAMAMVMIHSNGSRMNQYHFHKASDGWQLLIPANVMKDYANTLQADAQSPEAASP